MFSSSKLAARPTFTRKTSDISHAESQHPMIPLQLSRPSSTVAEDSFEALPMGRRQKAMHFADNAADRTAQIARTALPYWREGLAFGFAVGVITWLGVLTHKVLGIEHYPYCDEMPGFYQGTTLNPHI